MTSFTETQERMKAQGYFYLGTQSLTRTVFQPDTERFETVHLLSKDDIIKKLKKSYRKHGVNLELELIDQEGLSEEQQAVYVFARKR